MWRLSLAAVLALMAVAGHAQSVDQNDVAKIDGTTAGVDLQPVGKVKVTLRSGSTDANQQAAGPKIAVSDDDGNFSFEDIQPGRYTLIASLEGYETNVYRPTAGSLTFTLTAGQHLGAITLKMVRQSILSGEVRDEDGKTVARVTVRPLRRQLVNGVMQVATAGAGVQTGEDGKFQVPVATGRWYLSYAVPRPPAPAKARSADEVEMGYVKEYYPGVTHASEALALDVAAGQSRPGLDVKLRKSAVFHIRGKAAGKVPADTALGIQVAEAGGDFSESLFNEGMPFAADGSFDIGGLPAGSWTVTVARNKGNGVSLAQRTLQVGDRNIEGVVLTMREPIDISGSVKTVPEPSPNAPAPPAPAPHLQVRLAPLDSPAGAITASVQSDGTFTLSGVGARRYGVSVVPPSGGYVKSISCRGQEVLMSGIDLTESADGADLQIVISMTSGAVTGTVKVETEQPPPAAVTLMPVSPQPGVAVYRPDLRRAVMSGAGGQFSLASVAPGKYHVYAWERLDTNLLLDPDALKLFDSLAATVTVSENDLQTITVPLISADRMDDEIKRHGK